MRFKSGVLILLFAMACAESKPGPDLPNVPDTVAEQVTQDAEVTATPDLPGIDDTNSDKGQIVDVEATKEARFVDQMELAEEAVCQPDCEGKQCGVDGCGGKCGECPAGMECTNSACFPKVGTASCAEMLECSADCLPVDAACLDACLYSGTNLDQNVFKFLGACVQNACGEDPGQTCMTEAMASPCQMPGDACQHPYSELCDFAFCYFACPPADDPCYEVCTEDVAHDHKMNFYEWEGCALYQGAAECDVEDVMCILEAAKACPLEDNCVMPGDGDCLELYTCFQDCPPKDVDDPCALECTKEASAEAIAQWQALVGCLEDNGKPPCQPGDEQCGGEGWGECEDEFKFCVHGDDSCYEIHLCCLECPDSDKECKHECALQGSIEGQDIFSQVNDCVVDLCGYDGKPECYLPALEFDCKEQVAACLADVD